MSDITTENLIKKLDSFSWKRDKPKRWLCSKFAIQITLSCFLVSFVMFVISVWMGIKEIYEPLMVIGSVSHVVMGVITLFTLWHTTWTVLKKIAPEEDICLQFELDKKKCIKHALITTLIIVSISVAIDIKFIFLSGIIMAIVGCVYSVVFMIRIGKYFPIEFFYALKMKYLQETGMPNATHFSGGSSVQAQTVYGINPASGLPMSNNSFDVNGNVFGTTSRFHDDYQCDNNYHWDER